MNITKIDKRPCEKEVKLAKKLGVFDYFAIGFGSIIGAGWVIVVGDWIDMGGGVLTTILAFILGALILIPIALVYGELTAEMPVAGGAIVFTLKAFGSPVSYFTGWCLALGYIMLCPWEAIAVGQIFESLFPAIKNFPLYSIGDYTIYGPSLLISLLISIVIIVINYKGVEYAAKVQRLLTMGLIILAAASIFVSFSMASFQNMLPLIAETPKNPSGSFKNGIFSVLAITPFFFAGFDTIPQEAEECSEGMDLKKLSKTIFFSIFAACIFYGLVIAGVSMAMPWQELIKLGTPAAEVYEFGLKLPAMSKLILLGALCGLITTLNSFLVAGARVLLALGRSQFISPVFSRVHPVNKTPYVSNTIISVITLAGPFIGKNLLLPLSNICSFGFMAAWLMVCLSSIKLKQDKLISISSTIIRYLSVCLSLLIIMVLIIPWSPGALKWPFEWGLIGSWIIIGLLLYSIRSRGEKRIDDEERLRLVLGE